MTRDFIMIFQSSKTLLKIMILALLGLLVAVPFIANQSRASAIALKQDAIVTGSKIKLGDLFEGLESNHERVLGIAPAPGESMTINARTLMRVAISLDLPWRPISTADFIVVKRAATIIDHKMIAARLKEDIAKEGLRGDFTITLSSNMNTLSLPADNANTLEISNLKINRKSNNFQAILYAPSKQNPVIKQALYGSFEKLIDVPVLKDTLSAGDYIGQRDVDILQIRESLLGNNIILSRKDLVGMTPRRVIKAGELIRDNDIEAPKVVQRGQRVTMTYKQGPLLLTARGKALEHGAEGDFVRVTNLDSSKTIEALVTGQGQVEVQTF